MVGPIANPKIIPKKKPIEIFHKREMRLFIKIHSPEIKNIFIILQNFYAFEQPAPFITLTPSLFAMTLI